ncbi:hypothetical protein [Microcoleus sp. EPA2]|uniref:hypothetical protein n=1 Tax=Microcoleus sp. EPA2 TaxID=2841654 RepID=UPI00312BAE67
MLNTIALIQFNTREERSPFSNKRAIAHLKNCYDIKRSNLAIIIATIKLVDRYFKIVDSDAPYNIYGNCLVRFI